MFKAYHGLRPLKINFDREIKVPERASRLQVGRELGDDYTKYGLAQLNASELSTVVRAPLPEEIDWSIFEALDFTKMAANLVTRGRRKKG